MNNRLDLVIESFRDYIRSIKVSTFDGEIEVEYTLLSYDYIDQDLDFDEEYYANMCQSFNRWLETTAADVIKENEAKKLKIVQNRMIFRNTDEHVKTTVIKLKTTDNGIRYLSIKHEKLELLE